MIALRNPKLKEAVGWLAYIDHQVRAIPDLKPVKLHLQHRQTPERTTTVHTVIVGSCGGLPGGIPAHAGCEARQSSIPHDIPPPSSQVGLRLAEGVGR
jgi:hypothetical protein